MSVIIRVPALAVFMASRVKSEVVMNIPYSALYLSIAPRNLSISGAETLPSQRLACKATRVVRKSSEVTNANIVVKVNAHVN